MSTARVGLVALLVAGLGAVVHGATIHVDTTVDSLAVDGSCSLREAVLAANGDVAVDTCAAGSGADVVQIPAGTYMLTLAGSDEDAAATGDLDLTDDVELAGAGADTTMIDGGGADRVLDVDPAGLGRTVRVSGVTLQHGGGVAAGGGVRNAGALTIADSVVEDNASTQSGAGVDSSGSALRLERCEVRDNRTYPGFAVNSSASGGGVRATVVEVVDSTIASNVAQIDAPGNGGASALGGGISATTLTVVGSAIHHNQAIRSSLIGPSFAGGAGVSVGGGTIRNSTISSNAALFGGGILASGGTLSLSNTTVTANGAGGFLNVGTPVGATLELRNTIIAGNDFEDCSDFFGTGFTVIADAYNLDGDGTCGLSGTDQSGADPLLGPLQDNGGPTFTHALISGSPAIDMGSPAAPGSGGTACEATDQRGVMRPVGPRCDIGAFEGEVTTTSTTTSTTTTTTLCEPAPRSGCQPALGEKSKLDVKDSSDDRKDKLSWSWTSSGAVSVGDFGFPATTLDGYALCLYGAGGRLRQTSAPGIGVCGKKPCWKATSWGFVYTDPLLDPDGLQKITLHAGAAAGKGKIKVKGKGANLGLPGLPFATPVRVQLVHASAPACWDATFSSALRNDAESFKGKSDP